MTLGGVFGGGSSSLGGGPPWWALIVAFVFFCGGAWFMVMAFHVQWGYILPAFMLFLLGLKTIEAKE